MFVAGSLFFVQSLLNISSICILNIKKLNKFEKRRQVGLYKGDRQIFHIYYIVSFIANIVLTYNLKKVSLFKQNTP